MKTLVFILWGLCALVLYPHLVSNVFSATELTISGTLYSITSDDYVLKSENHLYYIRKEKLSVAIQGALEKHPTSVITLHVPMKAVDAMRMLPRSKTQ